MSLLEKYPYLQECLDCIKRDIAGTNLYIWNDEDYPPSAKQIKGSKAVIACNSLQPNEEIFFSQDMTLFDDGEIGCLVTDQYLYYKERWGQPIRMFYEDVSIYYGNGYLEVSGPFYAIEREMAGWEKSTNKFINPSIRCRLFYSSIYLWNGCLIRS